ncbi:MAG: radical SAM protein [Clostridiales bacterium]|nr:radical SAM protein [Clostridiales bacterium]
MVCNLCPRKCNVDRDVKTGFCGSGNSPAVAKAFLHKWEEPCISGTNGSGTVFFSGCNLRCVFCQNHTLSHDNFGSKISVERLAEIFLELQSAGAHNINLVTPSHFALQIREAVLRAKAQGLIIPVVYNSNGYDSLEALHLLEGVVSVYLPDIKYFSSETSWRYSSAADYFEVASAAVKEMFRQVGPPTLDGEGLIKRGLIIRHLILPGQSEDSINILKWIGAELGTEVYISLMSQYTPMHNSTKCPEIDRRITSREYSKVVDCLYRLGLENGYVQERSSASEEYTPDFNLEGVEKREERR